MFPRTVIIGFALVLLFSSCSASDNSQERPPNILLIMADDLGYEAIGANGNTVYQTPNLDALAAEGMRFTNAHSTPLCTPTRVQIMTGKYNFRNYVGFGILDPGERTFGHLLQDAGYTTAVAGKWQLYGNEVQLELAGQAGTLPEEAGFDAHYLWQVQERGFRFKHPHLDINGRPPETFENDFGPDIFADSLLRFFGDHRDEPFFAYFPMVLTHDPFRPTPLNEDYNTIDPDGINDPQYFAENVQYMDEVVGRLADGLDELGIREQTLIIFIGDNGTDRDVEMPYEGEMVRGEKGFPVMRGTHVPMIVNWKGSIAPDQVNENLIDFTDFVPTFMEVAGAALPTDFLTDGLSFLPQLLGEADAPARSWIYGHYAPVWGRFVHRQYAHDHRWKLFNDGEFYDYREDVMQEHPIDVETLEGEALAAYETLQGVIDQMAAEGATLE